MKWSGSPSETRPPVAAPATLLLDAGAGIRKVQELLGHRHITTTEIYDQRRRSTSQSASHEVPL